MNYTSLLKLKNNRLTTGLRLRTTGFRTTDQKTFFKNKLNPKFAKQTL